MVALLARGQTKADQEEKFEFRGIQVDAALKTAEFPAIVNATEGLLEYFLVGSEGKTHESLLVTKIDPTALHTVMLLLGAKGAPPENASAPSSVLSPQKSEPMKGDRIAIKVSWGEGESRQMHAAEELIFNSQRKEPMTAGPWTYNGSYVFEGRFLAQDGQSFVALVDDPEALINNPREGRDDDQIWTPNPKTVPPLEAKVDVTITILRERPDE
jgi:hypothetical protein